MGDEVNSRKNSGLGTLYMFAPQLCLFYALSAGTSAAQSAGAEVLVDWSGPYAAISLGGVRSDGSVDAGDVEGFLLPLDRDMGVLPGSVDDFESSLAGGLAIGTNLQRGAFVGGVEAGFYFMDNNNTIKVSNDGPFPPPDSPLIVTTNTTYKTDIDNLISLTSRGGFTWGRNLFYVSAGVAAANVNNEFGFSVPGLPAPLPDPYVAPKAREDRMRWGYTLGVGYQRQVSERISLRFEVMHFDLEDVTLTGSDANTPGFTEEMIEYHFDNRGTLAMLGIAFRF